MKFQKTLFTGLAAAALTFSIAAPIAMADPIDTDVTSHVEEVGEFAFSFTGNPVSFSGLEVTTYEDSLAGPTYRSVKYDDTHAYNPTGFKLQIDATPLTHSAGAATFSIDSKNLSVRKYSGPGTGTCTAATTHVVNGGNDFQTVTVHMPAGSVGSVGVPMSDTLDIVSGSTGRGCGSASMGLAFYLNVPEGTYTGEGEATYTGSMTVSNTFEAGESQDPV